MDSFEKLLQHYLDNVASEEERLQLFQLILSGAYDNSVDGRLVSMIKNETRKPASHEEHVILQRIYNKLHLQDSTDNTLIRPAVLRWWIAAAAAITITAVTALWVVTYQADPIGTKIHSDKFLAFSGKQFIRLPDGTTVLLNDSSQLSYREPKGESLREVTLTGEAYFDVSHRDKSTFVVRSGKVITTVLGTAFNIKARPHSKDVVVTVTRGKVQVGNAERNFDVITPDQQLSVDKATLDYVKTNVNSNTDLTWKNSFLIIDRVTLSEAAMMIAKKYNVTVNIESEKMKHCIVSSTFTNNEDLEDVLRIISTLVQGDFTVSNGVATLTGKGCS